MIYTKASTTPASCCCSARGMMRRRLAIGRRGTVRCASGRSASCVTTACSIAARHRSTTRTCDDEPFRRVISRCAGRADALTVRLPKLMRDRRVSCISFSSRRGSGDSDRGGHRARSDGHRHTGPARGCATRAGRWRRLPWRRRPRFRLCRARRRLAWRLCLAWRPGISHALWLSGRRPSVRVWLPVSLMAIRF